jgi:hypothetical protein
MVIYIETSVPSGWGREVFDAPLKVFYDDIRDSDCTIIVPQHTLDELEDKKTPDGVFEIPRINRVNKEKGLKPVTVIRPEEIKQWLNKLT